MRGHFTFALDSTTKASTYESYGCGSSRFGLPSMQSSLHQLLDASSRQARLRMRDFPIAKGFLKSSLDGLDGSKVMGSTTATEANSHLLSAR